MGIINEEVKAEVEENGLGHCVESGRIVSKEINDPKLAELWAKATSALNAIESYLGIE